MHPGAKRRRKARLPTQIACSSVFVMIVVYMFRSHMTSNKLGTRISASQKATRLLSQSHLYKASVPLAGLLVLCVRTCTCLG
ncbi:hypothetical protein CPB86DRAFT_584202 [Serendipita vermifera]|nr:hypothetical protein CPB86DRAFT_584202 [Serendipita vermifera]